MERAEDIRHTKGMKELYDQRKETIERIFGTAKENHGFRYTNMIGNERMKMKAALTFACMNLKKMARIMGRKPDNSGHFCAYFSAICDMLISRMKIAKFCFVA